MFPANRVSGYDLFLILSSWIDTFISSVGVQCGLYPTFAAEQEFRRYIVTSYDNTLLPHGHLQEPPSGTLAVNDQQASGGLVQRMRVGLPTTIAGEAGTGIGFEMNQKALTIWQFGSDIRDQRKITKVS